MAKAKINYAPPPPPPPPPPQENEVVLTLTMAEAKALTDVLNHIGGAPETTRRGLVASIRDALHDVGIRPSWPYRYGHKSDLSGTLYFEDTLETNRR